jgi:TetR/AcrR family fatty acid metabolism transcriptional regulator
MVKKAEQRREQILKAAFEAVSEKGYNAVTLQDIADYAEVSKGVTNYYFKNKIDVFANLLEWTTTRIYEKEAASIKQKDTAEEKLEAYMEQVFIGPKENKTFYRIYLDFLSQAKNVERYREINLQFYENCWAIGKEIITKGMEEGVFDVEDVDQSAKSIRSMIDGSLIQWLMREEEDLHDEYKAMCHQAVLRLLNHQTS